MPQSPLKNADERRLRLVLDVGHGLEREWARAASSVPPSVGQRRDALAELVVAIAALADAEDENLRRLAFHTRNLSIEMSAKHLAAILVPFERLNGKALRDDEILVDEGDRTDIAVNVGPMRVIADNLRSAFNVGAIMRTAECFGVEHVCLAGYTPTPENEKTARTSLGTEKSVSWSSDANVHDVITRAKADGYSVIALETGRDAVSLDDFIWPAKCALLLGNERFGLDQDVLEKADHVLKIPMHGQKNSLNVGIACGIALASWRSKYDQGREANNNSPTLTYKAIGTYHSHAVHPYEAPRQAVIDESGHQSKIKLSSDAQPTLSLKGLEGFDRVWLVYDFHHNENWKPLVVPPRGPHVKRGVFATRSPYRPNSIGLSCVELVKINGDEITVTGSDLLDGTPILDIKPYVAYADSFPNAKVGWLADLDQQRYKVSLTTAVDEKLRWLEGKGDKAFRGFIIAQLEFDPTDGKRKRVQPLANAESNDFTLAYRTWRIDFRVSVTALEITVLDLRSGYSETELIEDDQNYADPYADKATHRGFLDAFPQDFRRD